MSNPTYRTHPAEVLGSDALAELALDLRWSYNHAADAIWRQLDPELWKLTRNPWLVLQTASSTRLAAVTADAEFQRLVEDLMQERRDAMGVPSWFERTYPDAPLSAVAYFSMEYMLTEALPIYSGGLGNVAGDQLKAANVLGVPVVGVGLLYQQGYFRQVLDSAGRQQAVYPFNDPGQLPIRPLRNANGEWVRFPIDFSGFSLWVRGWYAQVGRIRLYLLDTNDPANTPAHRGITGELYGGDAELRLQQEIVLGIGGWRLLHAIGVRPEVAHLNEGHAAFAILERARCHQVDHDQPFNLALTITRAGNVFTTHTPVDAGFDRFPSDLMAKYFELYAAREIRVALDELLALGRREQDDPSEPFNMAYLALRGSGAVNGVSRLHGTVSRRIFQPLFPRWPEAEVPVNHVTNGVHVATWESARSDRLWEGACGKARWRQPMSVADCGIGRVRDEELWAHRSAARADLIAYLRERRSRQLTEQGAPAAEIANAVNLFNPATLTIGFARRFASYKRPNLLLDDPDRFARILTNRDRPVQIVIAGKAHPKDLVGQALITQWIEFGRRPEIADYVIFLADYDMLVAECLVQGVDLWINTPRRPWEACGTSGMKVLVNGGLNLSELDGWWAEAYTPEVGWAIGDGQDRGDDPSWDAAEANAMYALLEGDVTSAFYTRDTQGIPDGWVKRMRESMTRLTPVFSASRTVHDYTDRHYVPAAAAYRDRSANHGAVGARMLQWRESLERQRQSAKFGDLEVQTDGHQHAFRVHVDLGSLDPAHVGVELYADGEDSKEPLRLVMTPSARDAGTGKTSVWEAVVTSSRPATDFTPRLVALHAIAHGPLEAPFILWAEGKWTIVPAA